MMKNIYFCFCFLVLVAACRGPEGLPGPQGPKGNKGDDGLNGESPFLFEFNFDFTSSNNYEAYFAFPKNFVNEPTDVVLVYLFWDTDNNGNEIWRLLPQSEIMEFGWLQYNYDFTLNDVGIFLEADFPLSKLGPDYTHDWLARIIVVPSYDWKNGRMSSPVDFNDYNAVKEFYNLPDFQLPEGAKVKKRF